MRADRWGVGAALLVLSLLLVGAIASVPYFPTNDGPEWILATHIENHYGDPGTLYAQIFVPSFQFASHGFATVYGPLEAWLGWQRGLSVALSLTALLVAWGFFGLVREVAPRRSALAFLGFPLALSWEFYMGFWAFVVSTGLGLFLLALVVRWREPTWKQRAWLAVFLLAQAVAHLFGAILTGVALLIVSLARVPASRRPRELALVALTGLPTVGILVASMLASGDMARVPNQHAFVRLPLDVSLAMFPQTVAPGPFGRACFATLLVAALSGVAAIRVGRRSTEGVDRGLGITAIVLLLAGVFGPLSLPGWQFFSQRFVPLGALLAVASFPLERLGDPTRRVVAAVLFVVTSAWIGLSYPFHQRLAELCPDAIAGLSAPITMTGEVFPLVLRAGERPDFDPYHEEVPLLTPLFHMHALYETALGGVPSGYFGDGRGIYPFKIRPRVHTRPRQDTEHYGAAMNSPAFARDPAYRREIVSELASFALFYDRLAVFGALPEDLALLADRGFVADWAQGTALVAHFEPCAIDFTAPSPATAGSGPVFDLHVGPLGLMSDVRVPPVVRDDGLTHYDLVPAPCGPVSVHVRWEPSADGGALACRNADADGAILTHITRTSHRVTCDLR